MLALYVISLVLKVIWNLLEDLGPKLFSLAVHSEGTGMCPVFIWDGFVTVAGVVLYLELGWKWCCFSCCWTVPPLSQGPFSFSCCYPEGWWSLLLTEILKNASGCPPVQTTVGSLCQQAVGLNGLWGSLSTPLILWHTRAERGQLEQLTQTGQRDIPYHLMACSVIKLAELASESVFSWELAGHPSAGGEWLRWASLVLCPLFSFLY